MKTDKSCIPWESPDLFTLKGVPIVEINTVSPQEFSQSTVLANQSQKAGPSNKTTREKSEKVEAPAASVSTQDQVTLSKEAHELSSTTSQPSKNNTFQHSPSPFDR